MTWRVAGAARATTGTRSRQEDAFEIWPPGAQAAPRRGEGLLAVVADGMGGHAGGEIAGRLASRAFVEAFAHGNSAVPERLHAALDAGNAAIASGVARDSALRGMGCTLIGAWLDRTGLSWVSVGDSLLIVFRAPEVRRLNADHSLGGFLDEQARRREITAEEALRNPHRHALRSALTGKSIAMVDLRAEPYAVAPGDWLILASDGIATLDGDEIGDIVYAGKDASPEEMAERLIAAVLAKNTPDQDNTTVLALKIIEDASEMTADEMPTRVLRSETAHAAAMAPPDSEDIPTTQRIVQPPRTHELLRKNRTLVFVLGMGLMFVIGWALRALLG